MMAARIGGKTGGRRRGSLDKGERQIVTAEMAGDILAVYKRLGGVKWLLEFAKNNPAEFIRSGLSRLWPAPQKDDPDIQINQQFNVGDLNEVEAARRVAFALAKAVYPDPSCATLDAELLPEVEPEETYVNPNAWTPPTDAPDMPDPRLNPEPVEDPNIKRWASELPLTAEQRRDNALIRETIEGDLSTYRGGAGEQPGYAPTQRQQPQSTGRKPTVNEIRRRQLL